MRSMSSFKVYSIDQKMHEGQEEADKKAILTAAARRRDAGQNDRYFGDVSRPGVINIISLISLS